MKKLLLTLGTTAAIVTPIASVVSCSVLKDKGDSEERQEAAEELRKLSGYENMSSSAQEKLDSAIKCHSIVDIKTMSAFQRIENKRLAAVAVESAKVQTATDELKVLSKYDSMSKEEQDAFDDKVRYISLLDITQMITDKKQVF